MDCGESEAQDTLDPLHPCPSSLSEAASVRVSVKTSAVQRHTAQTVDML